jgi:hypothetical protein
MLPCQSPACYIHPLQYTFASQLLMLRSGSCQMRSLSSERRTHGSGSCWRSSRRRVPGQAPRTGSGCVFTMLIAALIRPQVDAEEIHRCGCQWGLCVSKPPPRWHPPRADARAARSAGCRGHGLARLPTAPLGCGSWWCRRRSWPYAWNGSWRSATRSWRSSRRAVPRPRRSCARRCGWRVGLSRRRQTPRPAHRPPRASPRPPALPKPTRWAWAA